MPLDIAILDDDFDVVRQLRQHINCGERGLACVSFAGGLYGVVLLVCARGLHTVRGWARGPVLLSQLILLGLAWSFKGGSTLPIAILLALAAAIVLAGLLHPRSIDALEHTS